MAWRRVNRCKECGQIYKRGIPFICKKCGAEIGRETPIIMQALGGGPVTLTDKCEKVIAKKTLLGWRIRKENCENESNSQVPGE